MSWVRKYLLWGGLWFTFLCGPGNSYKFYLLTHFLCRHFAASWGGAGNRGGEGRSEAHMNDCAGSNTADGLLAEGWRVGTCGVNSQWRN